MTDTIGAYGAMRTSWYQANPRETLKNIILSTHKTGSALAAVFKKTITPEELDIVIEYYVANNELSLRRGMVVGPTNSPPTIETTRHNIADEAEKVRAKIFGWRLSSIMPNNKPLAECTGKECMAWGGSLAKIGEKVGEKVVGKVLDEKEIREICRFQP